MAGLHDRAETLRHRAARHVIRAAEEPRVVGPGRRGEAHDSGAGIEGRTGLVEGKMAVAPDPENLEPDPRPADQAVVAAAFVVEIGGADVGRVQAGGSRSTCPARSRPTTLR